MTRSLWSAGNGLHRSLAAAGLLLCGVLMLSACGGSSSASKPQLIPALKMAQAALKDATGTFTFTSPNKADQLSGSGTCQITANPQRSLEVMKFSNQTQTSTTIVDGPSITYTQLPAATNPSGSSAQWLKSTSINAVVEGVSDVLNYAVYTKATQLADATINKVVYIHVSGVELTGSAVDLYLTKDTYLPVQAVIHHSDSSPLDTTITFSKTNSNVVINLPPANEVVENQ